MNRDVTPVRLFGADAPALVLDVGPQRAVVLHPSGDAHPNAVATRARLERRGVAVVPPPEDLEPYLRKLPWLAAHAARRILAAPRRPAP